MRLFEKALIREMTAHSAVALGALSAIVLVTLVVRLLGRAAIGDLDSAAVLPFIAFGYLGLLPVIFSLSLFIGVFMAMTRYWADSEMVIWAGAGLSPLAWIRPVTLFALPLTLLIALTSLSLIPWSAVKRQDYERVVTRQQENAALTPGVFTESGANNRVFFVESLIESGPQVRNVFIQSEQNGKTGIVVAQQGRLISEDSGERFVVLDNGHRYQGTPGMPDYQVMEFEHYRFRLQPGQAALGEDRPRTRSTLDLLQDPTRPNQAEFVWRIGYPLSAFLLALLAIPLSFFNPRAGRSLNVLFAILSYALYNNIVGMSENWVVRGHLNGWQALLVVHGLALAGLALAFWWRTGHRSRRLGFGRR